MLEKLSASGVRRRIEPGRVVLAAAAHGIVIFGAIELTRPPDLVSGGARVIRVVDMVLPQPNPEPEPAPATPVSSASETEVVVAPVIEDLLAPPPEVPSGIPPLVKTPPIPTTVLRRAIATPQSGSTAVGARIVSAGDADDPASVVFQPAPRYPPVLQAAGLEGRVLLEFIIDTTGHAEPNSLRVIERTRDGFDAAARETIEHSLFRPARVRGQRVRQRTLQWVVFRIVS